MTTYFGIFDLLCVFFVKFISCVCSSLPFGFEGGMRFDCFHFSSLPFYLLRLHSQIASADRLVKACSFRAR